MPEKPQIAGSQLRWRATLLLLTFAAISVGPALLAQDPAGQAKSPAGQQASPAQQSSSPTQNQPASNSASPALPRGKKLMLKDGSFQLVREYKIEGDRIRYYSIDQSQWEEMPESLVDWDATRKIEAAEAHRDAEIVAKAHVLEKARTAESLDIDASLEVAPGVFLPPGEGVWEFDGKGVFKVPQAEADIKASKTQLIKQVLIPIPIVPTRHTVSLIGPRARLRIHAGQTEFYMRTADGREPELELLRARVRGDKRALENLDKLFQYEQATGRVTLLMQRWQIAPGVYRFTLEQKLEPGEYALAEIVQGGGTNLYFWDFGLNAEEAPSATK